MKQTPLVHEELARRNVLPQTHVVDAGYVDAGLMVQSREGYGVELLGPVSRNNQWQARSLEKAMTCQDLRLILRQERTRAASARAALCVLGLKRNPGSWLFVLKRNFR